MSAGDVATLRGLNRDYVRSVLESDVRWFDANLALAVRRCPRQPRLTRARAVD